MNVYCLLLDYKVENRLSDKKVHELIDGLNPELRSVENINGKEKENFMLCQKNKHIAY